METNESALKIAAAQNAVDAALALATREKSANELLRLVQDVREGRVAAYTVTAVHHDGHNWDGAYAEPCDPQHYFLGMYSCGEVAFNAWRKWCRSCIRPIDDPR